MRAVCGVALASVALASVAEAATQAAFPAMRGPAVGQLFVSPTVSLIRTETALVCSAAAIIDIEASRYTAPDGAPTPFSAVVRSPAANVAMLADVHSGASAVRIEFKYALAAGPVLRIADGPGIDLAAFREAAGDGVLIDEPGLVARVRAAMASGAAMTVAATSRDTGRRVEDTLPPVDLMTLDACAQAAHGLPERALPAPASHIALTFDAPPDPARAASDPASRACAVTGRSLTLFEGAVVEATGFTTPTRRLLAGYDADGRLRHLAAPGLLDGALQPEGDWSTAVSVAADSNDPTTPNAVKGCLGSETARLCVYDDPTTPGRGSLSWCIGDLAFAADVLAAEDLPFGLDALETGLSAPFRAGPATAAFDIPPLLTTFGGSGLGGGGFGGGGGGGSGGGGGAGGGGDPPPQDPPVVPLPPAATLLLASLAATVLLRGRRRGAA